MIKFLVYPDYVFSKNDGDRHFISGSSLMHLYGVSKEECKVITKEGDLDGLRGTYTVLVPRYNGDYSLEKCKKIHLS
jgi:hypothetical protein